MKTALISLRPLEALGLKWVCRRLGWDDCDTFESCGELPATHDSYNIIVASADAVAMAPDFFMSRRKRLVIVTENVSSAGEKTITPAMDEGRIAAILNSLSAQLGTSEKRDALSAREEDVIREVAAGKTNREIADSLCISVNTVITHRKNISAKLGIRSASGLSLYALMNGLISPEKG